MPAGKKTDTDGNSVSASAQEQINALPARGTAALRKKTILENQIQREQADAERLERLKTKTLRKRKNNRKKTINKYVNGSEEEEEEMEPSEHDKKLHGEREATENDGITLSAGSNDALKKPIVEDVDEKAEEDRKMTGPTRRRRIRNARPRRWMKEWKM